MDQRQELQSLKRGLTAMMLINKLGSITIAALGRRMDLPRTTAQRILMTLLAQGFLERDEDTKAFFLTAHVHALSDGYVEEDRLVSAARPILEETTREIGWPLCLATPLGESMSVRVTTDTQTTLNLNRRHIGSAGPMGMVSSGIVFLAFQDPVQRELMLEMLRRSDDPRQAAAQDSERMDYILEQARANGYSFGLVHARERSVAVPVMLNGQIKAVLLMVFMARVLTNEAIVERFVPRLQAMALEIERRASDPK